MSIAHEHISRMVLKELMGTISDAEKNTLYEEVAEGNEAFMIWQEMHKEVESDEQKKVIHQLPSTLPDNYYTLRSQRIRDIRRTAFKVAYIVLKTILLWLLYKWVS